MTFKLSHLAVLLAALSEAVEEVVMIVVGNYAKQILLHLENNFIRMQGIWDDFLCWE